MTCYAFQLVGLISSYTFNFDGLTRSCFLLKDFFSVFLDEEFDVNLNEVDRQSENQRWLTAIV